MVDWTPLGRTTERLRRVANAAGRMPVRARWAAAAVLAVAFVLWLLLVAPRLLIPPASDVSLRDVPDPAKRHELQDNRLKLQNDVRTTLLQGLGGLAVLVGAFFTYRQLHIAREGQVTERFTRAIDQLGHENLDVRLGGIYALERIANDSPQDRATVVEVLTAFVRDHAPWPPRRRDQPGKDVPINDVPPLRAWAADVQAALTVLGRRKPSIGPVQPVDLTAIDLRGADLHAPTCREPTFSRPGCRDRCSSKPIYKRRRSELPGCSGRFSVMPSSSAPISSSPSCRTQTSGELSYRRHTSLTLTCGAQPSKTPSCREPSFTVPSCRERISSLRSCKGQTSERRT